MSDVVTTADGAPAQPPANDDVSVDVDGTPGVSAVELPPLDKPPLDPRVLRNVIVRYEGESIVVPHCDVPVYHGHGVAEFRTGFTYSGAFHFGRMHGHGRIEWTSGVVYDGAFVDNEMTGHGTYAWPNGSTYVGDVVRGHRHGRGVFCTGTRGAIALHGDAHAGPSSRALPMFPLQFTFQGAHHEEALEAVSNARYEGQWVDGLPHGRGVLVFDDDQHVRYEGDFVAGKRHGHGEMRYASGNTYVGQWADDVKCGHGTMVWRANGSAIEKYDGEWRSDRPHGHGRHAWLGTAKPSQREKNWYEGDFADGVRHGLGAFFYANGARYEGEWVDNVKHGSGMFFFEDGRVFVGEFRDDRAMESSSSDPSSSSKILLFVDDLLPLEGRDKARKLIENAVLRLNTELRALYRQYIALPAPGSPTRQPPSPVRVGEEASGLHEATAVLMEYYECRRLLADCGLKLSAGHLERHLQCVRDAQRAAAGPHDASQPRIRMTDAVTLASSLPEVVAPTRLLLFREFVELLVRLADEKLQLQNAGEDANNRPPHELADAFVRLYEKLTHERQARTGFAKGPVSTDTWATTLEQLHTKELHAVFQKHHRALQQLFLACDRRARPHPRKATADPDKDTSCDDIDAVATAPETVSVKSLLAQLQELHVFSSTFRVRHGLFALNEAFSLEEDGDADARSYVAVDLFFVDTPLVFTDFVDAIAVVLHAKQQLLQDDQQQQAPNGTPLFALVDDFAHALPAQL